MIMHLTSKDHNHSGDKGGMKPAKHEVLTAIYSNSSFQQEYLNSTNQTSTKNISFKIIDFNEVILDAINSVSVGSNTIILCFWVHSKYDLKHSKDKSSLIVNRTSIIVLIYYILTVIIGSFVFYDSEPEKFLLFNDILYSEIIDPKIHIIKLIYQVINSISFLLMLNFYFMVIKEVVLRKHLVRFFRGRL